MFCMVEIEWNGENGVFNPNRATDKVLTLTVVI